MLLLPRVPLIREKHTLKKCFALIDPPSSDSNYKGKICSINSVPNMLFSPNPGLSRWGRSAQKLCPKNLLKYWFSVMLGPDSFDLTDFKMLKISTFVRVKFLNYFPSCMSGLWRTFSFKTSSTESSWIYLYQFPKHPIRCIMSTSTRINKTSYNLQTLSRFLSRHNKLSRFLHHGISTEK